MMTPFACPHDLSSKICEALGIDMTNVSQLQLICEPDSVPVIGITRLLTTDEANKIVAEIAVAKLTAEEMPSPEQFFIGQFDHPIPEQAYARIHDAWKRLGENAPKLVLLPHGMKLTRADKVAEAPIADPLIVAALES